MVSLLSNPKPTTTPAAVHRRGEPCNACHTNRMARAQAKNRGESGVESGACIEQIPTQEEKGVGGGRPHDHRTEPDPDLGIAQVSGQKHDVGDHRRMVEIAPVEVMRPEPVIRLVVDKGESGPHDATKDRRRDE
jgi:hypothetical protein